jgi:SAM-dependent methyltransferase
VSPSPQRADRSGTASDSAEPGRHGRELYDRAELYDIAYDWDVQRELLFVLECIQLFGRGEPGTLLEPACGTGRNLLALGRMGLRVTGYDCNPQALDWARRRLREEGLDGLCQALPGEMGSFEESGGFDGAFNTINSFRYLVEDHAVQGHLERMGRMLGPGGIYVVDLSYAMPARVRPRVYRWDANRDGLHIEVVWRTREDRDAGLSRESCTLHVTREGLPPRELRTRHLTRLWTAEAFEAALATSGWELAARFRADFSPLPAGHRPDGRDDNIYHVLRMRD